MLFTVALTDKQVQDQAFDFNLSFLDPFVQLQLGQGKPDYDPNRS